MEIQRESKKKVAKEIISFILICSFILVIGIIIYPIIHLMLFKI